MRSGSFWKIWVRKPLVEAFGAPSALRRWRLELPQPSVARPVGSAVGLQGPKRRHKHKDPSGQNTHVVDRR